MGTVLDIDGEFSAWVQEDVDDMMDELKQELENELTTYFESEHELCHGIPLDLFTVEDIDELILREVLTEQDVIEFYGNDCWRDIP